MKTQKRTNTALIITLIAIIVIFATVVILSKTNKKVKHNIEDTDYLPVDSSERLDKMGNETENSTEITEESGTIGLESTEKENMTESEKNPPAETTDKQIATETRNTETTQNMETETTAIKQTKYEQAPKNYSCGYKKHCCKSEREHAMVVMQVRFLRRLLTASFITLTIS